MELNTYFWVNVAFSGFCGNSGAFVSDSRNDSEIWSDIKSGRTVAYPLSIVGELCCRSQLFDLVAKSLTRDLLPPKPFCNIRDFY